jgi:hypothetical protein
MNEMVIATIRTSKNGIITVTSPNVEIGIFIFAEFGLGRIDVVGSTPNVVIGDFIVVLVVTPDVGNSIPANFWVCKSLNSVFTDSSNKVFVVISEASKDKVVS